MLFGSLVELHVQLHSCLCFSLLEKLFLSNLNNSSTPLDTWLIYQALQLLFIAILIASQQLLNLSRKFLSPRQLLDPSSLFLLWTPLDSCSINAFVEIYKSQHLSFCRDFRGSIYRVHAISNSLLLISLDTSVSSYLLNTFFSLSTSFLRDFRPQDHCLPLV